MWICCSIAGSNLESGSLLEQFRAIPSVITKIDASDKVHKFSARRKSLLVSAIRALSFIEIITDIDFACRKHHLKTPKKPERITGR